MRVTVQVLNAAKETRYIRNEKEYLQAKDYDYRICKKNTSIRCSFFFVCVHLLKYDFHTSLKNILVSNCEIHLCQVITKNIFKEKI